MSRIVFIGDGEALPAYDPCVDRYIDARMQATCPSVQTVIRDLVRHCGEAFQSMIREFPWGDQTFRDRSDQGYEAPHEV